MAAILKSHRQMDEPKKTSSFLYTRKQQNRVFGKSSVFGDLKVSGGLAFCEGEQTNLMKRDLLLHISCIFGPLYHQTLWIKKKISWKQMCCNVNAISQRLHE